MDSTQIPYLIFPLMGPILGYTNTRKNVFKQIKYLLNLNLLHVMCKYKIYHDSLNNSELCMIPSHLRYFNYNPTGSNFTKVSYSTTDLYYRFQLWRTDYNLVSFFYLRSWLQLNIFRKYNQIKDMFLCLQTSLNRLYKQI